MDEARRSLVRRRAGDRCESCHLRQEHAPFAAFQIEHVIPRKHHGSDDEDNLALACDRCNLHKGPNLSGIDPQTGTVVRLFNPRQDVWDTHFEFRGAQIVGRTLEGRATADVCNMNAPRRVRLRKQLVVDGELD